MECTSIKLICFTILGFFLISTITTATHIQTPFNENQQNLDIINDQQSLQTSLNDTDGDGVPDEFDLDPNVDLWVTVQIQEIRALDTINRFSDPKFYVKVFINGNESTSQIWTNSKYVKNPNWSFSYDVPDDNGNVSIKIQLWDKNTVVNKPCDISGDPEKYDADLLYSLAIGHWGGDDWSSSNPAWSDPSGYGRLNGYDDRGSNLRDRDCELRFNIYQNDTDGDSIPYWVEKNEYGTDPLYNDTGNDTDVDGVPIEWEWKWGWAFSWHGIQKIYDPNQWENHVNLDQDYDGLTNIEEYNTSQWGSDPFRKDIFLEVDLMAAGPNGETSTLPSLSKELLRDAFAKRNIIFQTDDGWMGGSDPLPFKENATMEDLQNFYMTYFLHGDPNNPRRGVFRYAVIVYSSDSDIGAGRVFVGDPDHPALDCIQLEAQYHDAIPNKLRLIHSIVYKTFSRDYQRAVVYASVLMHETGHTLGIYNGNTPGCDNPLSKFPWQKEWLKWLPYKSCMNYGYVYKLVDYSDGSHHFHDFDDWDRIDLTLFNQRLY